MKNLYRRFSDLTGRAPRTVATCISSEDGESLMQYPGGAYVTARGTGTVGQRYFILDGRLDGEAPILAPLEIEI